LQSVYDEHPRLAQDEKGNLAIREVAIMLLSRLGQVGFTDTAAAIRSRFRVTHMYLDFLDTRDDEGNPFSPDSFIDACADDKDLFSLEYSLGQEGPLTAIWDEEWEPPETPSEYYMYLMIEWYD
jgi:hypothetical protein